MTSDVDTDDAGTWEPAPFQLTQTDFYDLLQEWQTFCNEFKYEVCAAIREAGDNSRLDVGLNAGSQGVKDICDAIAGAGVNTSGIEARLDDITGAIRENTAVMKVMYAALIHLTERKA